MGWGLREQVGGWKRRSVDRAFSSKWGEPKAGFRVRLELVEQNEDKDNEGRNTANVRKRGRKEMRGMASVLIPVVTKETPWGWRHGDCTINRHGNACQTAPSNVEFHWILVCIANQVTGNWHDAIRSPSSDPAPLNTFSRSHVLMSSCPHVFQLPM